MENNRQLDQRVIKEAIINALKNQEIGYVRHLEHHVCVYLQKRGYHNEVTIKENLESNLINENAKKFFMELFWELVILGIIVPGGGDPSKFNYPFTISDLGHKAINEGRIVPSDKDGFLLEINNSYPESDFRDVIFLYLEEALNAYNKQLNFSAIVMLGVAAEGMINDLGLSIKESHKDSDKGTNWFCNKFKKKFALEKHKAITDKLQSVTKEMIEDKLGERYEMLFPGISTLIRLHRNYSGHPNGKILKRDDVRPIFWLFPYYSKIVSDLISWLKTKKRF